MPTVVDGLARSGAVGSSRLAVVIARGTYAARYDSAEIIEYHPDYRAVPAQRYVDVALGKLVGHRPGATRAWRAAVANQASWPEGCIIGHNGPQLMPLIDTGRHQAVLYCHNFLLRSYGKREIERTLGSTSKIICVSNFLAETTASVLPAAIASRIRVVPNGVDCTFFSPRGADRDDGVFRVMFLGRMIPDKGADVLLHAIALLNRADVEVTLVGSHGFDPHAPLSPFEVSLRAIAETHQGGVRFIPTASRAVLPDLLRSSDVLVVPSRWPEPFGLTVTEGLASGLPVVASAVGGIPEALGDAGILVPPDDPRAMAHALGSLADDPELRSKLGENARARALGHDWTWSRRLLDDALGASS